MGRRDGRIFGVMPGARSAPARSASRHPKNDTHYASLDKLAADPRVEHIWEEGADGIWVSLADGYRWEDATQIHEWSVKDVLRAAKSIEKIEP